MVDVTKIEAEAKADVAKAAAEVSFVRANWGKLSAVFVAAAILGACAARLL